MSFTIVGTSFHQDQLKAIFEWERDRKNHNKVRCELRAEPNNRFDKNAIAVVYIGNGNLYGSTIAHVKKEDTHVSLHNQTIYLEIYHHLKYNKYCCKLL